MSQALPPRTSAGGTVVWLITVILSAFLLMPQIAVMRPSNQPLIVKHKAGLQRTHVSRQHTVLLDDHETRRLLKTLKMRASAPYRERRTKLYNPIILKVASQYRVDPDLVKAIIMVESEFDPVAVSHKGAQGLMQLMPMTAEELGVQNAFNPEQNIQAGVKYFRKLLNMCKGDVDLALAAYNAGYGKVLQYNGIPPYKPTQSYIEKVFEHYLTFKESRLTEKFAYLAASDDFTR